MQKPDLRLHIGLHKTGSTRMQRDLMRRKKHLTTRGVEIFGPKNLRLSQWRYFWETSLALVLRKKGLAKGVVHNVALAVEIAQSNACRAVVISDEELAGSINKILKSGVLYPDIAARMRCLDPVLRGGHVVVVITVRNYADIFASLYAHRLKTRPLADFDTYKKAFLLMKRRWGDVVADVTKAIPGAKILVIRFEDVIKNPHSALCHTVGDTRLGKSEKHHIILQSPSAAAVAALHGLRGLKRRDKKARKQVMEAFPRNKHPAFDPWSIEERQFLDQLYRDDMANFALINTARVIYSDLSRMPKRALVKTTTPIGGAANVTQKS